MNTTVDFETAKQLQGAGFVQPELKKWGLYWCYDNICAVSHIFTDGRVELIRPIMRDIELTGKQFDRITTYAPTALEIIEQMPIGTLIKKHDDCDWTCWFPIGQNMGDYRSDKCPHKAAALAYIAWKKWLKND